LAAHLIRPPATFSPSDAEKELLPNERKVFPNVSIRDLSVRDDYLGVSPEGPYKPAHYRY